MDDPIPAGADPIWQPKEPWLSLEEFGQQDEKEMERWLDSLEPL